LFATDSGSCGLHCGKKSKNVLFRIFSQNLAAYDQGTALRDIASETSSG
jgi:hypothetical protein